MTTSKDELYYSINYLEKFLKRVESFDNLGLGHVPNSEDDITLLKEIIARFDKDIKALKLVCFNSTMQYIDIRIGSQISNKDSLDIYTKIRDIYEQK